MKKKIYLSGKISGDPDFKEKFAQKERELTQQGYHVFNPAVHPDMFTWEQFMELDLMALANCDSIYLLNDWKDSRGAKMEYDQAVKLGKEILFENKNERVQNVLNDKSDQRLTVTYQESNEEKKIRVQLCEQKSWKYRVMLDDKSMTPWQYSDHEPKAEDYIDVKNFYTKQRKKNIPLTKIEEEYIKKLSRNFDENINHYKEDGSGFSEWFIADIAERNKKEFAKLPPEKQKDILDTWKERFPSGDGKINKKEILNFLASKVTDLHEYSKTKNTVAKHKKSDRNDSSMSR